MSGRFRGRAIFDSTARHVRGVIGPYSRRRTASASTSEGSPNPRPYPNKSATVLEPNRLSSSSQLIRRDERGVRHPARAAHGEQLFPERHHVVGEPRGLQGRIQAANEPGMLGRDAGRAMVVWQRWA